MEKKLHRDEHHKVIGGVCAGLAEYFGTDVAMIRVIFVVLAALSRGTGVIVYFILWAALPKKGLNFNPGVDYRVPPQPDPFNPFTNAPQGDFNPPPFVAPPKKKASKVGLIIGVILIMIGGITLVDQLDLIPDWDFNNFWPLVLVGGGIALIASGFKKQPWEKNDWRNTDTVADEPKVEPTKEDNEPDNTPPTI